MAKRYHGAGELSGNLPMTSVIKDYPKNDNSLPMDYDDSLAGIDDQQNKDNPRKKGIYKKGHR